MEKLKRLVEDLEKKTDKGEIVEQLQIIGRKLVTEYEIKAGDIVIKPLVVEAYYYNPETFPDCNTHMNSLQKEFNVLYRHAIQPGLIRNGRVGGVDICLALNSDSDKTYYLSFLIKNALIDNEFYKQVALNAKLNSVFNENEIIRDVIVKIDKRVEKANDLSYHCRRVNLAQECYKSEELAVFTIESLKTYPLTLEIGKEKLIAKYIYENQIRDEEKAIKDLLGYSSSSAKEYLRDLKQGKIL